MNVALPTLVVLLLLPFALAHNPAGTPKNYCEPTSEWDTHDYAGGFASVSVRLPNLDGNLGGDCDGSGFAVDPTGPSVTWGAADFDGHHEWSIGWARLLVNSGAGVPSPDPSVGAGTFFCFGFGGHHPAFGPVTVDDSVLGGGATFYVMADTLDLTGVGNGCGDGQVLGDEEGFQTCLGSCAVTFPPGLDGSYMVFVTGIAGHIVS